MSATISEGDKVRARHVLGYLNVEQAQTFVLGMPAGVQTQFMIEGALNRVLPQSLDLLLRMLDYADGIECELFGGIDLASVSSIAEIKVNPDRRKELAGYYKNAQQSIANLLGIIPNPFDQRDWLGGSGGHINVPVSG